MTPHPNRPHSIFYSLNRRYRVVCRSGEYLVQRRHEGLTGRIEWRGFGFAVDRDRAIQSCGWHGGVAFYQPGEGWL